MGPADGRPPIAVLAVALAWAGWRAVEGSPAWLEAACPAAPQCPACPACACPQVELQGPSPGGQAVRLLLPPVLTNPLGADPLRLDMARLPLDVEAEWYSELAFGQYGAVECDGDGVDDESSFLHLLGDDVWWIFGPDGDEYFLDDGCQGFSNGTVLSHQLPAIRVPPPQEVGVSGTSKRHFADDGSARVVHLPVEVGYLAYGCDQVSLGAPTALEVLCERLVSFVAAHAHPRVVPWEVAECYADVQPTEAQAAATAARAVALEARGSPDPGRLQGAGGRPGLAASRGQRSLFPLPLVPLDSVRPGRGSDRLVMVNDALKALNRMAGWKEFLWADRGPDGLPDDVQADVQWRVCELVNSWYLRHPPLSDEAALKKLLQGHSPYQAAGCPTRVTSFKLDLLSLPGSVRGCPLIADVAPSEVIGFLGDYHERMLAPPVEKYETAPYFDPKPRFNQKEYHRLLRRLADIGVITWTSSPKCHVGLFTVEKDGGAAQRLIVDARRANECFQAPPGVSLLSSEGLSRIEVELPASAPLGPGQAAKLLEDFCLSIGLSDVSNCFRRLRVPAWLSDYFCLPPAPAHVMGASGAEVDGSVLGRAEAVTPCWAVLPMGFTWSLWIAQMINETTVTKVAPSLPGSPLHDRGPPLVVRPALGEERDPLSHYVYVDNLGVIGVCEAAVGDALEQLGEGFNREGLLLYKSERSRGGIVALGAELDGAAPRTRVTPKRFWNICQALGALLRRRRASARAFEVVLGRCTFAALCCRGLLSVSHSVYASVERGRASGRAGPLWDECRSELQAFRSLMIFMFSDWLRSWNDLVAQTDSGLEGCAVAQAFWPWQAAREARPSEGQRGLETLASQRKATLRPPGAQPALRGRLSGRRHGRTPSDNEDRLKPAPRLADVGESSSTSGEGGPRPGAALRTARKRTGRQRGREQLITVLTAAAGGGHRSPGESSVALEVLERCQSRSAGFDFSEGERPRVHGELVDGTRMGHLSFFLFMSRGASEGIQILAGLMSSTAELSRAGRCGPPRACRCRRGWRQGAPGRSWRSWSLTLWAGLARMLTGLSPLQAAVLRSVSLGSRWRPNKLMSLKPRGTIAPAGGISLSSSLLFSLSQRIERSRATRSDVSIEMDSPLLRFIRPVQRVMADGPKDEMVRTVAYLQSPRKPNVSRDEPGIAETIVQHQRRHVGPSIDIFGQHRTVSEAQRRGQSGSIMSVQRCDEGVRLSRSWELLPDRRSQLLEAFGAALEDIPPGRPHDVAPHWRGISRVATSSTFMRGLVASRGPQSSKVAMLMRMIGPMGPAREMLTPIGGRHLPSLVPRAAPRREDTSDWMHSFVARASFNLGYMHQFGLGAVLMADERPTVLMPGECFRHPVLHDDGSDAGSVVGVVRRVMSDNPGGTAYEVEYFAAGDQYLSWWLNSRIAKREKMILHVCRGPVSRCRYTAPRAGCQVFHTRAPQRLTAVQAAERHMAVLQHDEDCPELPADVALAALDEAEAAEEDEEPPPSRAAFAGPARKRPAGVGKAWGDLVELDGDEEADEADADAFAELDRELAALSGKSEGTKSSAKDGYLERLNKLREKLATVRGPEAAAGGATAAAPTKKAKLGEVAQARMTGQAPSAAAAGPADGSRARGSGGRAVLKRLAEYLSQKGDDDDGLFDSDDDRVPGGRPVAARRLAYKKIAEKHPGRLSKREMENVAQFLDHDDAGGVNKHSPLALKFLLQVLKPAHPIREIGEDRYRELRTLAESADLIVSGKPIHALDFIFSRIKAVQNTIRDGHSRTAKWFELTPPDNGGLSLSVEDEELAAGIEAAEVRMAQLLGRLGGRGVGQERGEAERAAEAGRAEALSAMSDAAIGSEVAALTLGQWKADIASRMCRSGPSQMTMLEIGFGILTSVRRMPSCIGDFARRFPVGVAPQSPEAGVGRDVLPLPVREPATFFAWERDLKRRGMLDGEGSPVDVTKWPAALKKEAQAMAVEVWTFLSALGLNYLYLGHLSTDRWEAAGRLSEVQAASLRVIGEAVEWRVGDALAAVDVPFWPQEMKKTKSSYDLEEDCRALPLKFGELEPGLPKAEDIGRLDVLDYVGPELKEVLTKPEMSLLPEAEWPESPPKAKVNVEKLEDWWAIAAKLVERGLLAPIPAERIFVARGRRVTNWLFAATKSGGLSDSGTLAGVGKHLPWPRGVLLWSGDDQKGAFFVYRIPAPRLGYMAICTPVPGHVLGMKAKETVLPMGWVHSVPIFQSVHRRVALLGRPAGAALPADLEWRRDRPIPAAAAAPLSHEGPREWWSAYIDDFDNCETAGCKEALAKVGTPGRLQALMRGSYQRNAIPIGVDKANQRQLLVTRMGVEVDGISGRAANNPIKNVQLYSLTMWLLTKENPHREPAPHSRGTLGEGARVSTSSLRGVQLGVGADWLGPYCVDQGQPGRADAQLPTDAPRSTNLRAATTSVVSCSDASEGGAGMCTAVGLAEGAAKFLASLGSPETWGHRIASYTGSCSIEPTRIAPGAPPRVLLVSLFDGIGGAAVSLVRAGFDIVGYMGSEVDKGARRVLRSRWPGLIELGPVEEIHDRQLEARAMFQDRIVAVVVAGGSPCQDTSGVNADRQGAHGARSGLFKRIPKVVSALALVMKVPVHWLVENVLSMSAESLHEFSRILQTRPISVCNSFFTENGRPRLYWLSWREAALKLPGAHVEPKANYNLMRALQVPKAPAGSWVAAGCSRASDEGPVCTFLQRREKTVPYKPAGLSTASPEATQRWTQDLHAYPPYQYELVHMIRDSRGDLRPLCATEKEVLMGFPRHYSSSVASSGSSRGSVENDRCSLLGNAFACCVVSWLFLGLKCQLGWPVRATDLEGITSELEVKDLLDESVEFSRDPIKETPIGRKLVEIFWTIAEKSGSDVRLDIGVPFRPKAWPRSSIDPALWRWRPTLSFPWPKSSRELHINALELKAVNASLRHRTRTTSLRSVKVLHLVDSQVAASILTRGRTSPGKLRGLARQYAAILVSSDLYVGVGYINTKLNPSDRPSREFLIKKWRRKRVQVTARGGRRRSWLHVRSQFSKRGTRLRDLQVTKATRDRHVRCVGRLFVWWRAHSVKLSSLNDADKSLSLYMEACWAELEPLYLAVNATAALQWTMPSLKGNLQQSLAAVILVGFDAFMRTGELLVPVPADPSGVRMPVEVMLALLDLRDALWSLPTASDLAAALLGDARAHLLGVHAVAMAVLLGMRPRFRPPTARRPRPARRAACREEARGCAGAGGAGGTSAAAERRDAAAPSAEEARSGAAPTAAGRAAERDARAGGGPPAVAREAA
ncbi:unnamed protein product [Prorocentrum cordatum]|uniref:DNA (cytosine-5-)-methyltransferase n=1 Tax=Prorocentrum cordatum TaxID=2364126 RepID=A0ABN9XQ55_9DINO|nr:unnamed protein product [Polarella glacialis]